MSPSPQDAGLRGGRRGRRTADEPVGPDAGREGGRAALRGTGLAGRRVWTIALAVSLAAHAVLAAVVSFPRPEPDAGAPGPEPFRHVELPPAVRVPASPAPVPRPPAPRAREVDVREPMAAGAGAVPSPPTGAAPRPPDVPSPAAVDRPSLARADVPPIMEAPDELRERLRRSYPERLRELEEGGVVELRFFIDESGDVARARVSESSGHPRLDRTAVEITREVTFLPAMIRDRAVGIWVSQRICFVFVEEGGRRPTAEECERRVAVGRR